jgi:hypothetical protein
VIWNPFQGNLPIYKRGIPFFLPSPGDGAVGYTIVISGSDIENNSTKRYSSKVAMRLEQIKE